MNKIPEIGERYAVAESDRVDSRYWGLIGTVADVDLARLTVRLDIPRHYADALTVWLHADYLLPLDDAGHIIRSAEAEEEKREVAYKIDLEAEEEELKRGPQRTIHIEKRKQTDEEKRACEEKVAIVADVREDPPVAVPGFITVTASPASFMISFGTEHRVREMVDIRDILCVIEQEDGRALIVRRSDEGKVTTVPPLVTVEDFDEVARRMRRAAE